MSSFVLRLVVACVTGAAGIVFANADAWADPTKIPNSAHLVWLQLPDCDEQDPEVRIITTADLPDIESILNDPDYRIFCITPGDYTSNGGDGEVRLTRDGTANAKRWLRHYDPNITFPSGKHAIDQTPAGRAVIAKLVLKQVDYWIIDAITIDGSQFTGTVPGSMIGGSSHNILNRLLIEHGRGALLSIAPDGPPTGTQIASQYNVVQNSVIRNSAIEDRDNNCLNVRAAPSGIPMAGNVIVNNEIYDCTDSIQLVCCTGPNGGEEQPGPLPGTIIDQNDLYVTPALYTDGNGEFDPDGDYACAEGPLDVKQAGTPEDPLIVTNNRLWGSRPSDPTCTGSGSHGDLASIYSRSGDAFFAGNIVFDGARGLTLSGNGRHRALRNVIADIREFGTGVLALHLPAVENEVYFNTVAGVEGPWLTAGANANNVAQCNVARETEYWSGQQTPDRVHDDYNAYYGVTLSTGAPLTTPPATHDVVVESVEDAELAELCLKRRRFTAAPQEEICIPDIVPTASTPKPTCEPEEFRCELKTLLPSSTACDDEDDDAACQYIGTENCTAYPASWFE